MTTTPRPLNVGIVGSGPAGLFLSDELLRKRPGSTVAVYERLALPFGLVRYGVMPDHPHTRRATALLQGILQKPGVTFHGGIQVGRDVSVAELRNRHDAVVLATGAGIDRDLGIPGEHLPFVHGSSDFCAWINGHPEQRDLPVDLATDTAVVIGNGNVALDCARILARPHAFLQTTDISPAALAQLATSRIRTIYVLGRRGPAQNSFGAQEIAEFATLEGWSVSIDPAEVPIVGTEDDRLFQSLETLRGFGAAPAAGASRIIFRFFARPVEIRTDGIVVERTRLEGDRSVPTGATELIPCGLVLRAAGHRGQAIPGVPFDEARFVTPHTAGRIEKGLYCVGWIKRGAKGLIGHNRRDAMETAAAILADL